MKTEIIAEISGCHGGSLGNAIDLIKRAREAGATGVKFQCFDPERLAIRRAGLDRIQRIVGSEGLPIETATKLRKLYEQTYTHPGWFGMLKSCAMAEGLTWHASVFDPLDIEFLEGFECPRYKISSFEAHDDELVGAVRKTGKPWILSVNQGDDSIISPEDFVLVLHATDYAVPAEKANLVRMRHWYWGERQFGRRHFKWGLSDHTTDRLAGELAAAYSAAMIEWHIRLPDVSTPDDAFSWTPTDFALKVRNVREIEKALQCD